jgi:hypothetical protein
VLTPRVDGGRFFGTTGVGPTSTAARRTQCGMIDHLGDEYGSRGDAYVLASRVDLKTEVVDAGGGWSAHCCRWPCPELRPSRRGCLRTSCALEDARDPTGSREQ